MSSAIWNYLSPTHKVKQDYSVYESGHDLRSRKSNQSGWKRTWKNSGLTGNRILAFAITGRNPRSIKPEFFWLFFNRLDCSFYYEDHVHFHNFTRSSKYESFHIFKNYYNQTKDAQSLSFLDITVGVMGPEKNVTGCFKYYPIKLWPPKKIILAVVTSKSLMRNLVITPY